MDQTRHKGEVGRITIAVPGEDGGAPKRVTGPDLDDVLRDLVDLLIAEFGWTGVSHAADNFGLKQRSLADFMDGTTASAKVLLLSHVCAATKLTPVKLFRLHPLYRPETREAAEQIDDPAFDRLRAVLTANQAKRLARIVQVMNETGAFEKFLAAQESLLRIDDPSPSSVSHRKGRRRSR